jgi:dihydroneopterin aldolase/2-amino-4-hydroxy-6-hydroxymethyldihydropteridine diphosphokinase
MTLAYVAVGSNLEPERHIVAALEALRQKVAVEASSSFYRTAALGRPQQTDFVNGVWRLRTSLPARRLKVDVLRGIEADLGRERTGDRYAPRTIDLDLILFGEEIIDEPDLIVPDPDILRRPFIARPLLELYPDLILPGCREALATFPVSRATEALQPLPELSRLLKEQLER